MFNFSIFACLSLVECLTGHCSARVDVVQLKRNVQAVGEALARVLFPVLTQQQQPAAVFEGAYAPSAEHLQAWLGALAAQSRFAPYLRKDSPLIAGLERVRHAVHLPCAI